MSLLGQIKAAADGPKVIEMYGWQNADDESVMAFCKHAADKVGNDFDALANALVTTYKFPHTIALIVAHALLKQRETIAKQQSAKKKRKTKKSNDNDSENEPPVVLTLDAASGRYIASEQFAARLASLSEVNEFVNVYMRQLDPSVRAQGAIFLQMALFAGPSAFVAPSDCFRTEWLKCVAIGVKSDLLFQLTTDKNVATVGDGITFNEIVSNFKKRADNWLRPFKSTFVGLGKKSEYFNICRNIIQHLQTTDSLNIEQLDKASPSTQRILVQLSLSMTLEVVRLAQLAHPLQHWWRDESTLTSSDSQSFGWLSAVPGERALISTAGGY
jgi:hypothetical protein